MTGFNMPPGVSPSQIPGNRPEDMAYEAAWEWAEKELQEFTLQEFKQAILAGKAAVIATREIVQEIFRDGRQEGQLDIAEKVEELQAQVRSLQAFKASVDEALNLGDGSYRP